MFKPNKGAMGVKVAYLFYFFLLLFLNTFWELNIAYSTRYLLLYFTLYTCIFLYLLHWMHYCVYVCTEIGCTGENEVRNEHHLSYALGRKGHAVCNPRTTALIMKQSKWYVSCVGTISGC